MSSFLETKEVEEIIETHITIPMKDSVRVKYSKMMIMFLVIPCSQSGQGLEAVCAAKPNNKEQISGI